MATWLLVYIVLANGSIDVGQLGSYSSMVECFHAREELLLKVSKGEEYFPINQQAICIKTNVGF